MIASHYSAEPGAKKALELLGLDPCLKMDMRLGEGSGCPIAFSIVELSCAMMNNMATFDEAGINGILVGDSLGMVCLGYEDTLSVTMEDMIHHSKSVARGAKNALVVTDMPFMSYQTSVYDAVVNAGRLIKEGHADAVKLEGGVKFEEHIRKIVAASIPVVGHIGMTPQSVNAFGGFESGQRRPLADLLFGKLSKRKTDR